jgi:hypothetical protein
MKPEHIGDAGWVGVGLTVLAFDYFSPETLSHAFKRGLSNPNSRPFIVGALAITAAHLCGVLPVQVDPFAQLERRFKHE